MKTMIVCEFRYGLEFGPKLFSKFGPNLARLTVQLCGEGQLLHKDRENLAIQ